MPDTAQALLPLGYAIAIGLLVGLERGWTERAEGDGRRVAGIRTFGLLGLAGGVAGLTGGAIAPTIILSCAALLIVGYWRQVRASDGQSATSSVAGLLVLGLGYLAASGQPEVALASAAVAMALLSSRKRLHALVKVLSAEEIRAVAEFAIVALVLFPLAPDRGMGPYDALNPHRVLLIVVLVSGISFAAYLATHHLPRGRGPLLAATLGALVSSTAVTVALARRLRAADGSTGEVTAALLVASIVSCLRVLVLVAALAPAALGGAATVIIPGVAVLAIAGAWAWDANADTVDEAIPVGNPLELGTAVTFALIAVAATLGARLASTWFGGSGPLLVLTATGMADVDAAILAFSSMSAAEQAALAGPALAGPIAANMLFKAGATVLTSRSRTGAMAALALGSTAVAVAAVGFLLWWRM
jgi:uncharacterized membrane protein (DUF4010 family)